MNSRPSALMSVAALSALLVAQAVLGQTAPARELQSTGGRPLSSATAIFALADNSPIRKLASPVGLIYLIFANEGEMPQCVGTLISPHHILTASHCLEIEDPLTKVREPANPDGIAIYLDYLRPNLNTKIELELKPVELGRKADNMDFVVLRAKSPVALAGRRIPSAGTDPDARAELLLIHELTGTGLQVSGRECKTSETPLEGVNFRHLCDTRGGSSGAPIFDANMRLVGIHVAGGKGSDDKTNFALRLSSIMSASQLVKEALEKYGVGGAPPAPLEGTAVGTSERKINLPDRTALVQSKGQWSIETVQGTQRLRAQAGSTDEHVLWDPNADIFYRVPKGAGPVRRRKGGEPSWTEIAIGGA